MKQQKNTDFTLGVGNVRIACHRSVLSCSSPFFQDVCSEGKSEVLLHMERPLKDPGVLMKIVQYLYLGTVLLTSSIVLDILDAACVIQCAELVTKCEEFWIKELAASNVKSAMEAAERHHLQKLNKACTKFCLDNFSVLLHCDWYLPSLSLQDMMVCVQSASRDVDVVTAIITWVQQSGVSEANKETQCGQLLDKIHHKPAVIGQIKDMLKDKQHPLYIREALFEFMQKHSPESVQKPIKKKIVIAGGRETGEKRIGNIRAYDNGKLTEITTCKDMVGVGLYSVAADKNRLIVSGGYGTETTKKTMSCVSMFSFVSGIWTKYFNLPRPRDSHTSILHCNKLYVMAGGRTSTVGSTVGSSGSRF